MTEEKTIYDFVVQDNKGKDFSFDQFRGHVILIVNTASKCGFTPQFKDLEDLYQKYKEKGLCVIGFPCNQFASQDPGTDEEIASFCSLNYGVTFPMMKKIDVNGENEAPIYTFLKSKEGGWFGNAIKWNFTKFLVSKDGKEFKRYSPTTNPNSIVGDIEAFLNQN